jgi:hypothetical protein
MDKKHDAKRAWYLRNKAKIDNHRRETVLNGKCGLHKRKYTGKCELCGVTVSKYLRYHHWDDSNPSVGVWLCTRCHNIAEAIDKIIENPLLLNQYKELRRRIYGK